MSNEFASSNDNDDNDDNDDANWNCLIKKHDCSKWGLQFCIRGNTFPLGHNFRTPLNRTTVYSSKQLHPSCYDFKHEVVLLY